MCRSPAPSGARRESLRRHFLSRRVRQAAELSTAFRPPGGLARAPSLRRCLRGRAGNVEALPLWFNKALWFNNAAASNRGRRTRTRNHAPGGTHTHARTLLTARSAVAAPVMVLLGTVSLPDARAQSGPGRCQSLQPSA